MYAVYSIDIERVVQVLFQEIVYYLVLSRAAMLADKTSIEKVASFSFDALHVHFYILYILTFPDSLIHRKKGIHVFVSQMNRILHIARICAYLLNMLLNRHKKIVIILVNRVILLNMVPHLSCVNK